MERERGLDVALSIWVALTLVAPLAIAFASLDDLGQLGLDPPQWRALARAWARGSTLALVVASAACLLAPWLARAVPPLALLALLLTSRSIDALGVLAWGVRPGSLAAGLALLADLAPLAGLVVSLRMRTLPIEQLECAADLGAGPWLRLRMIVAPHLRPAFAVAFAWALLEVLGDAVALELAGGGLIYTPGLVIRDALVHEHAPARALVGMLGLLALALVLAWVLAGELGRLTGASFRTPPPASRTTRALGWASFACVAAIPLALVLGDQPEGIGPRDRMLAGLLAQTLMIAVVVASLAAALGFGFALALGRGRARVGVAAVLIPLALPASVYGLLALLLATTLGIRPGSGLTIAALLPQALALGFLVARVLIGVVPLALIDAAADLGADGLARLRWVWLPLGRPALQISAAVVFTWVLGQAAIPAFTSGPGGDTLAVGLTILARGGELELVRRWSLAIVAVPLGLAGLGLGLGRALARRPAR